MLQNLIVFSSLTATVPLDSLFAKSLPGNARGAMMILHAMMESCVYLGFNHFGGKFFDSTGPTAPYMIWSALSFVFLGVAITLVIFGDHLAFHVEKSKEA